MRIWRQRDGDGGSNGWPTPQLQIALEVCRVQVYHGTLACAVRYHLLKDAKLAVERLELVYEFGIDWLTAMSAVALRSWHELAAPRTYQDICSHHIPPAPSRGCSQIHQDIQYLISANVCSRSREVDASQNSMVAAYSIAGRLCCTYM